MVKRIQFDYLKQYSDAIKTKLMAYKQTHDRGCLGELAKQIHLDQSRLSNFMSDEIELTPTYVFAFIKGGFITVEEILRGKDLATMSQDERDFWEEAKILEDRELMKILSRIKEKGKDPKPVLKAAFLPDEP